MSLALEIVDTFLEDSNMAGKPASALAVAKCCGVWLVPTRGPALGIVPAREDHFEDGKRCTEELHYKAHAPREWRDAFILRCVARWIIDWYRYDEYETPELVSEVTRLLMHRPIDPDWKKKLAAERMRARQGCPVIRLHPKRTA